MNKCAICQQQLALELGLSEIVFFNEILPRHLCSNCLSKFQQRAPTDICCPICKRLGSKTTCRDCLKWQRHYGDDLLQHESLFSYNSGMEEWFKQYKYLGNYRLRKTFARELKQYFSTKGRWFIVPIPLSEARYQQRGFNQVEELLISAGQTYYPVLEKSQESAPQTSKNLQERLKTKQPFYLKKNSFQFLQDKKILLVDDVYTTGRTLYHARDCLKDVRALEVRSFSLAR